MNGIAGPKRLTPALWIVLALLSVSLLVNYVDRSSISTAGPLIRSDFNLSASQLGILFSAFSWTYSFCLILAGWMADRYNVNWVLGAGFALWSVATLLTGFANGFAAFLVLRLLLGMGESVAYPSYSHILVRHFPASRRGLVNSIIGIGQPGGLAIGTFAGALLMDRYGWRPFFVVLGVSTLLWLIPWSVAMPRGEGNSPMTRGASPKLSALVRLRSLWGTCGGLFSLNFVLYFMTYWLPTYLVEGRHFAMNKVATVGFLYLTAAIFSPIAGWLSDVWISTGATPTLARKAFMSGGQIVCALLLLACAMSSPHFTLPLLILAGVGFGFASSQAWAITQTLAGPNASGKWTGFQNFVGNFAGILGPMITGMIIDYTHGFFWAFALTAGIGVFGCVFWIFVVGPLKERTWSVPVSSSFPAVPTSSP